MFCLEKLASFLRTNLFLIIFIVLISFILNALHSPWWANCSIVFAICEVFHACRSSSLPTNDDFEPLRPMLDPYISDVAHYFLNKFRPVIAQAISDCEADIKATVALGSFKFVKVEIAEMVSGFGLKRIQISHKTISSDAECEHQERDGFCRQHHRVFELFVDLRLRN